MPGDPGGIGPELAARLLADPKTAERAVIGDACVFELDRAQAGASFDLTPVETPDDWEAVPPHALLDLGTIAAEDIRLKQATEAGGRSTGPSISPPRG